MSKNSKEDRYTEWITTYFYSMDSIEKIKKGNLDKTLIKREEKINFLELLSEQRGLILLPKLIGIYQYREPTPETPEKRKERIRVEEKRDLVIDRRLSERWGIVDNIYRNLIHIIYDSEIWKRDLLIETLNDELGRIALSPTLLTPNFYNKKTNLPDFLMLKEGEMREGKSPEDIGFEQQKKIEQKLIPEAKEIMKQLESFGLTKNEWYFLNSYLINL